MNKILLALRWQFNLLILLTASLLFSTISTAQISLSCPSDVNVTTLVGDNTVVATWNEPATTTSCTVPVPADCSSVGENISGFIYMGEYNGSKYFCSNGSDFTWFQARDLSVAAGGYLVTINDAGENEFVRSIIGADEVWIGYNDAADEGSFEWVNGEASNYENWTCWSSDDCEPNQTGDYVRLLKSNGEWGDQTGTCKEEFVMEIPCSACQAPTISGFVYMGMHNNSKYYCSDGNDFSWTQAKNLSAAAGGYLVTINDAAENEFVRSVIGADKVWIGYTDQNSEGDFYWVNAENSAYSNWKSWAPDGGSWQNYAVLYKNDGEWNDKGDDYFTEFVMEVPCANIITPGTVTLTQTDGQSPGSTFAIGAHTISYSASDDCGNSETCSFVVTVEAGQPTTPASVGDFVWSDTNGNGIQDAGEPGIEGVFVMITDCDGNWINNTVTDAAGAYNFTNLVPGDYKIKFVAPLDFTVAPKNAASDDANDSDVNLGWTGFTDCFTLASGENNTSIDAGFVPNAPAGTLNMTCNDDITVTAASGQTTAQVTWVDPSATSTCTTGSVAVSQSAGPSSGSLFPVGTTTISYNATDGCGNFQTCSFAVTVQPAAGGNLVTVGDFVWSDDNGNGIQDAGEQGLSGVFVMLTNCAGDYVDNTTTDANGAYAFANVAPGSYKVKFALLPDYQYAPMDAGTDDDVDSDVLSGWTGFTECFDVAGTDVNNIDAGLVPNNPGGGCDNFTDGGTIGGTQTICAGDDAAMLTTVALPTGGSGGIEYLWMLKTDNNAFSIIPGANGPSYDPGVLTTTTTFRRCARRVGCTSWPGESNDITVTVDQSPNCGSGNDPASVGDFVWSDTNGNGIQDAGEPGIADVFIMLTDCAGNWKGQTTSDANGAYSFTNVTPGSYKIKFITPADHTNAPTSAGLDDTKDSDLLQGWTGFTECFDLASGQNRTDIDAGFVPNNPGGGCDNFTDGGTIGGTQTICAGDDAAMLTTVALPTGGSGGIEYLWMAKTGTSCPNNASYVIPGANGPSYDPGVLSETTTFRRCARRVGCTSWPGESNCVTVTVDQSPNCGSGNDPASVGDFVWSDTNGNGIQDAGEPGIADVFIMLTDCAGNWKGQTTSDANGAYSFTNVTPGSYKIKFITPADHTNAPTSAGSDDTKDSDLLQGWTGFTECFDLASGQNRTDIDAGFVPNNPGGGCDNFTDGGTIGGTQTICAGDDAAMLTTVALPTGGSGGIEYLWMAKTGTSCPNNASYVIPGANGPSYDPGVLSETTTFRRCARRVGCTSWPGESNCVTVTVDQSPNCGSGNDPASVGDFVWSDTNGNGIQDAGEPGIADVFIMLTDCAGNWKGQTTSDANGAYSFTNVTPGSYKIKFVTPANHTTAPTNAGSDDTKDSDLLQGWTGFTECFDLASGQNRTDIDAGFVPDGQSGGDLTFACSNNITVIAPAGQSTAVVSWTEPTATSTCSGGATLSQTSGPMNNQPMAIGTQTVSYSAADNCGNYQTCSFSVTVEAGVPTTPGSVGDFVWNDLNENGIQDAGEPGLDGVFVMLTDCAGNWKGQTTTDANGAYSFTNVAPGSYKVKFVGPLGSSPAPTNAGSDDAKDSDLLQGWTGFTECFDVASGQDITNIDAGFIGITQGSSIAMNCNADISVTSSSSVGTIVTWSAPTATSTCTSGNVTVTQTSGPTSGSVLVPNTHTVTYMATDDCGNTETCSFTITVTYDEPAVCTSRTITDLTTCNGNTSTFWADDLIYGMSNISKSYHLVNDGTFTEYEDGTAHFSGVVVNNTNSNARFALDFTLTGKMAMGDAHDAYCFNADMSDWYYYASMTGTITGMGALEGAVINGVHHMYSPQIGTGANLHQNVFGFTSWVALDVVSQPNNSNITLDDYGTAHADLNFNLSGGSATCAPAVTTCATRTVEDVYQCNADVMYGFWAHNLIDEFWGTVEQMHFEEKGSSTFIEYSNGTAHLSMKVRNHYDHDVEFQIELDFSGRTFTALSDANDNAYGCFDADISDWYYYSNVTGTISGLSDMAGAEINVWNVMHPFQIGTGAALFGDWDEFGGTTWLGYEVVSQPDDNYYLNDGGQMDVNISLSGNAAACGGSDYTASSSKVMDLVLEQNEFIADLTWQNNTGDVNDFFVVERSTDGVNFTPIAQVASDATAENVVASYTYKDATPSKGMNYYQVVAVTKDNKKFISNKTQAVFGDRADIALFPNPAGEYFMIDLLPYLGAEAMVTISDQLGQIVKTINLDEVGAAPVSVSLDKFINGYYNVQIQTTDGRKASKKLVVARMY